MNTSRLRHILASEGVTKTAASKGPPDPGTLIDLMGFMLAWNAYRQLQGEEDPHFKSAERLIRRYQPILLESLTAYIEPLAETPQFGRFAPRLRIALRTVKGTEQAILQAEFIQEFLPFLRSKPEALRETFSGRARTTAMRVATAASEDSPEAVLFSLATVPPASRLQLTRRWVKDAAKQAGVGPSELEETLSDAISANQLGEKLRQIEARLDYLDSTSVEAVELQQEKQAVLGQIEDVTENSANPQVILAAATSAASASREYATKTGKERKLNPDKEEAMMMRGKGVLAAGAGAGKTMTLASKVVYHINELDVPATSVMATSFSRKSAAELRSRVVKYGANIDRNAAGARSENFNTTHKIGAALLRNHRQGPPRDGLKSYDTSNLVRLAIEQVQMGSPGEFGEPPEPKSLFDGLVPPPGSTPEPEPDQVAEPEPEGPLTLRQALQLAFDRRMRLNSYLRSFIEGLFDPSNRYYPSTMRNTKNLMEPRGFTNPQRPFIEQILDNTGVPYTRSTDPNFSGTAKVGKKKKPRGMDKFEFFARPANKWFNRGFVLQSEDEKNPIPLGDFVNAITKFKGRLVSPSEAWHQSQAGEGSGAEAAVYAAYEWLKGPRGEKEFQGKADYDDLLIDVSKMMLSSPRILKQIQSQFKVVLVDEAQDLNRSQHMMFGLVAGYVDEHKADQIASVSKMNELAKDDGSMTADTYVFIGDDKQAIYEFRAADPEAFIDMSDLGGGEGGFKTQVLETNYRSGQQIVAAANQLISHNKKQIRMTCKANPDRVDEGAVNTIRFPPNSSEEAAVWVADKIMSEMSEGLADNSEAPSYDSFGMALRTNAEAYSYGIELLKRGIPFRSKINFFRDKNAKALINWLTLADEGPNGNVDRINKVVLEARTAPTTMLGQKFDAKLKELATGNYLTWLQDNWQQIYGGSGNRWGGYVKTYVDNLTKVANLDSGLEQAEVLNEIMQLNGFDGESIREALIDRVWNNEESLATLRAASVDGNVSDEDVENLALAPLRPLTGLLEARPDLTEAMKYVRQLERANGKLSADDDPEAKGFDEPAVTLGTMHSWKGLEVPHIFIPMVGGRFPRGDSTEEDLASERRLAYVAITRGEDNVTVLDIPTERTIPGPNGPQVVRYESQFVKEMCVPTQVPVKPEILQPQRNASEEKTFPPGVSALDPEMMAAYNSGKDPFAVAWENHKGLKAAWGKTLAEGGK